jgi:hypothetical protein
MLLGLGGLAGARRRLRLGRSAFYLVLLGLLAGAMSLEGCSSSINGAKYVTPVGTSNVIITVTGPNGTTHTIPVQYTITGAGF